MLDLDSLVEKRAAATAEETGGWHRAVWSPLFQKLSQNMTDGEIERLLGVCPSCRLFEAVLKFLTPEERHPRPMATLEAEARRQALDLGAWVRTLG